MSQNHTHQDAALLPALISDILRLLEDPTSVQQKITDIIHKRSGFDYTLLFSHDNDNHQPFLTISPDCDRGRIAFFSHGQS